jgi:hypothetical protein
MRTAKPGKGNRNRSAERTMRKPPLLVVVIVLLDAVAALSSFFIVDRIGVIGASIEFLVFAVLAAGLWYLQKWAWFVEIALSVIQVVLVVVGVSIAFFALRGSEVSKDFPTGEFYVYMALLIGINVFVLAALSLPKVKSQFH